MLELKKNILKKEVAKRELFQRLSKGRCSLLFFYDEEPEGDFSFENIAQFKTVVNPPYSYLTLEKWLYSGNWLAIYPAIREFTFVNTFKTPLSEVHEIMTKHGVNILIDSFHDDVEWNVYELFN